MVQDRWKDNEAQDLKGHLALRVFTSRLLGQDSELVMHGGGNTSVKDEVINIFGEKEEVIYIKGSGWDLATIQEPGFPAVRLPHLLKLRKLKSMTDPVMVNELRTQMLDAKSPDPSVETLLHAFLPHRYVDHTHADAVLTLTNQPDGERWIRELYGKKVGIVPYVMPGFKLAKLCAEVYEEDPTVEGLVLLKHGIFSFGDTAKESYQRMIALVRQAEEYICARKKIASKSVIRTPAANPENWTAALRREYLRRNRRGIFLLNSSPEALAFVSRKDVATVSQQGPLTPDHVIRTKRVPAIVDTSAPPEMAVSATLDRYADEYKKYFERNSKLRGEKKIMLDALPRVILLPGVGVVTYGNTAKDARIAMDIYEHTMSVIDTCESITSFQALPEEDVYDVEYWVLEQAKLALGAKALPLSGKVAAISGGTTGIGLAIATEMLQNGADVFVLDIEQTKFESVEKVLKAQTKAGNSVKLVACDVSSRPQVESAISDIVREKGGIDIVVANAGIFPASKSVEAISEGDWNRTMMVNLNGTFHLLACTLPWLKSQDAGGDVILVASKNVLAPGKEAGAYSVSKAAQVQLARVTALEAGAHGIRVNMVHPHLVFDTALWTEDLLKKRADAYGMTVDQYKRNNLLKTEIASHDVARSIMALVSGAFAKTTGAQIPIDGGSDRTL